METLHRTWRSAATEKIPACGDASCFREMKLSRGSVTASHLLWSAAASEQATEDPSKDLKRGVSRSKDSRRRRARPAAEHSSRVTAEMNPCFLK